MRKFTRFLVHSYMACEDRPAETERTPVQISDGPALFRKALEAIQRNDPRLLSETLKELFVYPGDGRVVEGEDYFHREDPYHGFYQGNHHTRNMTYEYYYARPVIEALFVEHNELFQRLVDAAARSDKAPIHETFVSSFEGSDVPEAILMPWDEVTKNAVNNGIDAIAHYPINNPSCKSDYCKDLARKLRAKMLESPLARDGNYTDQMKWLNFKYDFIREMHSWDQVFSYKRDSTWKHIIANLAAMVLSLCTLNIYNYCRSGYFFFFKRTYTQSMIDHLDKTIDVPKLKIN